MDNFLKTRLHSFRFAFTGLRYVLKTQKNAWIHLGISLAVVIAGFGFSISPNSWAVVILTMGFVWSMECMNTAIEAILDLVSPQPHPLAKIGKDVAAAGVLVAAISAILIGLLIFGPPVFSLFFRS